MVLLLWLSGRQIIIDCLVISLLIVNLGLVLSDPVRAKPQRMDPPWPYGCPFHPAPQPIPCELVNSM
jgi:hypothetical protein